MPVQTTRYSDEVASELCERIAMGETLTSICREERMPDPRTVWKWRQVRPDFNAQFAQARVDQMHAWADQIVNLADDSEGDFKVTVPLDSPELERIESKQAVTFKFTRRHVSRTAQMIDVRKWLMARYAPEDFSDRSSVNMSMQFDDKSDDELVQDLRDAFEKSGMTPEQMLLLLQPNGAAS